VFSPAAVVEQEKTRLAEFETALARIKNQLSHL